MSESSGPRIYNVLFVCTGNSSRSIMAEAIMGRAGLGRFRAYSAGSRPAGKVNPHALKLLQQMHHDTSSLRSKSWTEFTRSANPDAPDLDFVFSVCDKAAAEVSPIWPGEPMRAHWGMPDPALTEGSEAEIALAFADTYRMLTNRISLFMNLPMASLDRLALQERLQQIGGPPKAG